MDIFDFEPNSDDSDFITEEDIDNCVIEKILQNRFHNPMGTSSDDDEPTEPTRKLDWDKIFSKKPSHRKSSNNSTVQGHHPVPYFRKLSALTRDQHNQCLKVLCFQNPNVLPMKSIDAPTEQDYKTFEDLKEPYASEQNEFTKWAKELWLNKHFSRALTPKLPIEMIYEDLFKLKAHSMKSFPKKFSFSAQISLEAPNVLSNMVLQKEIVAVNQALIPRIEMPDMTEVTKLWQLYYAPEPCSTHPCRFVLPNEVNLTVLPIKEIHRVLAQFACDNGASYIASEAALRCLVQQDRRWAITVSVYPAINANGDVCNVIVLGNEFSTQKEAPQIRTYKSLKALLEIALIPTSQINKVNEKRAANASNKNNSSVTEKIATVNVSDTKYKSDVDTAGPSGRDTDWWLPKDVPHGSSQRATDSWLTKPVPQTSSFEAELQSGSFDYRCEDQSFKHWVPVRSYCHWQVQNCTTPLNYDIIVHCPHRTKDDSGEVILEPIPEYQMDLGAASLPPPDNIRGLVLAMMLRRTATAITARVDCVKGDILTIDRLQPEQVAEEYSDVITQVSNRLSTALQQLQGLMPGNYVLQHEVNHGTNAMLYASEGGGEKLSLNFECTQSAASMHDVAESLKVPPVLAPALLPINKHREILPCAFTPFEKQVVGRMPRPRRPQQTAKVPKRKLKRRGKN